MKVLVTGSTGFIGNYVIDALLESGHEVVATSLNKEKAELSGWYNKVTYIPFDLRSFDDTINYFRFFKEPDFLIHLAWEGLPNYKSSFHEEVNLPGHFSFLKNLISNGLGDLTITGTCFEYGMQEGCLKEDMVVFPDNPYGRAKNQLRIQLEELQKEYEFLLKWVRLFYMYGKGQNPNSLLSQLDRALASGEDSFKMSGGQQIRDFLPVEKVAVNIVKIAAQKEVTGIINNCSGEPVTVEKFVNEYLQHQQKKIILNLGFYPYPDYEPMSFWGDITKLKKAINNE